MRGKHELMPNLQLTMKQNPLVVHQTIPPCNVFGTRQKARGKSSIYTKIIPMAKYYFYKVANCHLKHIHGSHIH
jgi:hypothetical protein